ncbi:hypothetical protein [Corynebacterium sp. HMSC036D02]|uniref:hypothetical protein n=1 Tax=Corynebacterium sp. HMSC036D02 TaxID=1715013 RepID=UPI0008A91053|nr:hypothetical protein [Corynebacterium sp. HMSC036D02]OHO60914.1 hypothetical protein HMPREF2743_04885 [Corynebacterium sp. HMSC036D02]
MDKDKLHRALAHIAAGADKMAQAVQVIQEVYALGGASQDAAKALADAGLLTPDPPEPCIYPDTGEHEWHMEDGYVSVEGGIIHVIHDEAGDDREPVELDPDPGELRFSTTTKGRETAYAILAACDHKDAQDD